MGQARVAARVRTELMQCAYNGQRECKELGDVALTSLRFDGGKVACIEELVPARQVDGRLGGLITRQLKLGHGTTAAQVMLIFICLTQARHITTVLRVFLPLLL